MKSKALVLNILPAGSLILIGIRTSLVVDSGCGFQEHAAEGTKRSAANNTTSAVEAPKAFGGLKKEGNQ
jgi:hypothetical protein